MTHGAAELASYGRNVEERDYELEYLDIMLEALRALNNPEGGDLVREEIEQRSKRHFP